MENPFIFKMFNMISTSKTIENKHLWRTDVTALLN